MANENGDGVNPGDDVGAKNDGSAKNTEGKTGKQPDGKNAGAGNGGGDDDATGTGEIVFKTKKDFDDTVNTIVSNRLNRERKDAESKAKMSETEKLEFERDAANKRASESDLKDSFIIANSDMPYDKALRMYKYYRNDLEVDGNGKITNLADVQKTMRAEFKELFPAKVKGKSDGGDGGNQKAVGSGMNDWLRQSKAR